MKMSERGQQLLIQWEGFKPKVYKDSAGLPTIGVGHLLTPQERKSGRLKIAGMSVRFSTGLTEEQVRGLLAEDLTRYEDAVSKKVLAQLGQDQFDALVSFCFNVGINAFQKSSLVACVNAGDLAAVPDELRKWTKAGGKQVPGLVNRRENEIKLWLGAV